MKNWMVILFFGTYGSSAISQNVGIGTNTPQEKLDVSGGIHATHLKLTGTPGQSFISATGDSVEMLDQNQWQYYSWFGLPMGGWQSFTAGITGTLTFIELNHQGPMETPVPLSVYQGEGVEGNPLVTVNYMSAGEWCSSPPLNIQVTAGQKYTISLASALGWRFSDINFYQNGKSSIGPDVDMTFKSHVALSPSFHFDSLGNLFVSQNSIINGNAEIVGDISVGGIIDAGEINVVGDIHVDGNVVGDFILEDGHLGLGTAEPTAKLQLSGSPGNLRIDGGTNTGPYFSFGGEGKFEIDAPYIPGGRFVITNDGNIGINNPAPAQKLDVIGNAKITGGLSLTGASADLDVDGPIRTKYSGSLVLTNITTTGLQTLNLTIPAVPGDWNFVNTMVMVSNSDGVCVLTIHQAKLSSLTNIELRVTVHTANLARFNYIIFKI